MTAETFVIGYRSLFRFKLRQDESATTVAEYYMRDWLRSRKHREADRDPADNWDGVSTIQLPSGTHVSVTTFTGPYDQNQSVLYRAVDESRGNRFSVMLVAYEERYGKERDAVFVIEGAQTGAHSEETISKYGTPGIVKIVLNSRDVFDASTPIKGTPSVLHSADVRDLLTYLQDEGRRVAITIAASPAPGTDDVWVPLVEEITKNSVGVAGIFIIAANAVDEFNNMLPPHLRIPRGSIRTYTPDIDLEDPDNGLRHRFLTANTIAAELRQGTDGLPHANRRLSQSQGRTPRALLLQRPLPAHTRRVITLLLRKEQEQKIRSEVAARVRTRGRYLRPRADTESPHNLPLTPIKHPESKPVPPPEAVPAPKPVPTQQSVPTPKPVPVPKPLPLPTARPRPVSSPEPGQASGPVPETAPVAETDLREKNPSAPVPLSLPDAQTDVTHTQPILEKIKGLLSHWFGIDVPAADASSLDVLNDQLEDQREELEFQKQLVEETDNQREQLQQENEQIQHDRDDAILEAAEYQSDLIDALSLNEYYRRQFYLQFNTTGTAKLPDGGDSMLWDEENTPNSLEELLTLIQADGASFLNGKIRFTGDSEPIEFLAERDTLGNYARTVWSFLHTLYDYTMAKSNGFDGSVEMYLRSDEVLGYKVSTKKHSACESESVLSNPSWKREREFTVPNEVDPRGKVFMEAHFRIGTSDSIAPRLYYYDNTNNDGCVYVGYIGRHLTNTKTN
jgi:hypothetical protein